MQNMRMGTFSRSWALAKESYEVLRRVPSLVVFPILSAIATIVISVSFFVPVFVVTGGKNLEKMRPEVAYPLMFVFYFLTYFVVIFFNSAMVACAYEALQGRSVTFAYGMSVAWRRIGAILGWTAIAATVGVILRTIAERTGIIGNIVIALVGASWNIATYFVVPVLVIEQGSPFAAVKKSTVMLKQTWGERLVAAVGLGSVMALLILPGFFLIIGGIAFGAGVGSIALGAVFFLLGLVYMLVLATISAALQGVFQTALFVYAETGSVPSGFNPDTITAAFKVKEGAMARLRNRF